MPNSGVILALLGVLTIITLGGCSSSQNADANPAAPWTYAVAVRADQAADDSPPDQTVFPRLSTIVVAVTATNTTGKAQPLPTLSLRIADDKGTDITPPAAYPVALQGVAASPLTSVPVADPPVLSSFTTQLLWNQDASVAGKWTMVPVGRYTVTVRAALDGDTEQTVATRELTISETLQWELSTRILEPVADDQILPPPFTTDFTIGQPIELNLRIINQGTYSAKPWFDTPFTIYDETRQRTLTPANVYTEQIFTAIPPGGSRVIRDIWNQDGYYLSAVTDPLPVPGADGGIIAIPEPDQFSPLPGRYRIDIRRSGEVIASRWITLHAPPAGNG